MIHDILHKVVREQTNSEGSWTDDIDMRVAEMQAKEGMRVCPVCNTSMPKTKRKCTNQECRVSLKSAEREANDTDILGTALVAAIRTYHHRVHETSLGFQIEEDKAFVYSNEEIWETHKKWTDVPSGHPANPIKMKTCDPVFLNPNSFDSIKEVLRRVDKPNAREWLSVTMDGSPYLVSRTVIDTVYLCCDCEAEVLKREQDEHRADEHRGRRVKFVQEFDWVLLRTGKLHLEMNMQSHSLAFTGMCSCVIWPKSWGSILKQLRSLSKNALIITKQCLF